MKKVPKSEKDALPLPPETRFLVVDDDTQVRETVVEYLRSFGYQYIHIASDGKKALEILEQNQIEFIVSDWEMPDVNGLELLKALRTNEKWKDIPFVMVTSPGSHERVKIQEAGLAQVDGYVIKPFRINVFKGKLEEVLEKRKLENRKAALVVDDDDGVRSTIAELLQTMSYEPVFEAKDGEEGLNLLKSHLKEIALIVSDWEMPNVTGIEFLRKVRTDPQLSTTPFILVTSQTSIERVKLGQAIEAEVDHYLMKPFSGADLRQKVGAVMRRMKAMAEIRKHLKRGEGALSDGDFPEARTAYNKALEIDPKSIDAHLGLARTHLAVAPRQNYEQAVKLIQRAINMNPRSDQAHIALAQVFETNFALGEAIACLKRAMEVCPLSADLHYHLGRLYIRRGRMDEGTIELKKALEINPDLKEAKELLKP